MPRWLLTRPPAGSRRNARPGRPDRFRSSRRPRPSLPRWWLGTTRGRITVRATRLDEPLVLDGKLDDPVYSRVKSVTGFVQQEPDEGKPETEKTETWILFDDQPSVRLRPVLGQPAEPDHRHRTAPGPSQYPSGRELLPGPRHPLRPAQRRLLRDQSARGRSRPGDRRRGPEQQPRLEHGVGGEGLDGRWGLVARDGDSLQVAQVQGHRSAGLGVQHPPHGQVEERDIVPRPDAQRPRAAEACSSFPRRRRSSGSRSRARTGTSRSSPMPCPR